MTQDCVESNLLCLVFGFNLENHNEPFNHSFVAGNQRGNLHLHRHLSLIQLVLVFIIVLTTTRKNKRWKWWSMKRIEILNFEKSSKRFVIVLIVDIKTFIMFDMMIFYCSFFVYLLNTLNWLYFKPTSSTKPSSIAALFGFNLSIASGPYLKTQPKKSKSIW